MPGAAPGQINIVLKDAYETFEHQMPVEEFIRQLMGEHVLDRICVVGLEDAVDSGVSKQLSRVLQDNSDKLNAASATIQFSVEGSFQRIPGGFELKYEGELFSLNRIFGAQLRKEDEGWLVAPF